MQPPNFAVLSNDELEEFIRERTERREEIFRRRTRVHEQLNPDEYDFWEEMCAYWTGEGSGEEVRRERLTLLTADVQDITRLLHDLRNELYNRDGGDNAGPAAGQPAQGQPAPGQPGPLGCLCPHESRHLLILY